MTMSPRAAPPATWRRTRFEPISNLLETPGCLTGNSRETRTSSSNVALPTYPARAIHSKLRPWPPRGCWWSSRSEVRSFVASCQRMGVHPFARLKRHPLPHRPSFHHPVRRISPPQLGTCSSLILKLIQDNSRRPDPQPGLAGTGDSREFTFFKFIANASVAERFHDPQPVTASSPQSRRPPGHSSQSGATLPSRPRFRRDRTRKRELGLSNRDRPETSWLRRRLAAARAHCE